MNYRDNDYRDPPSPRDNKYHENGRPHDRCDPHFTSREYEHPGYHEGDEYDEFVTFADNPGSSHRRYSSEDAEYNEYENRGFNQPVSNRTDPSINTVRVSGLPSVEEIRISDEDLQDATQSAQFPDFGRSAAKIAAVAGFSIFAVMLYSTMQPNVTAYDIISMEEYQGEQKPDWTLDPQEIEGCDSLSACFKQQLALSKKPTVHKPTIQEIPASTTKEVISPVAADNDTLPAQMQVSQQWSNIRETPTMTGAIVSSIAIDLDVEVLAKADDWYEILTLDGRNIRGYMHKNTLK